MRAASTGGRPPPAWPNSRPGAATPRRQRRLRGASPRTGWVTLPAGPQPTIWRRVARSSCSGPAIHRRCATRWRRSMPRRRSTPPGCGVDCRRRICCSSGTTRPMRGAATRGYSGSALMTRAPWSAWREQPPSTIKATRWSWRVGRSMATRARWRRCCSCARLWLEAEQYDSARVASEAALAADSSLVASWAMRGALAWLAGDSTSRRHAVASAEQLDRRPAEFWSEIAEAAARHRRYAEAVDLARRGVALDSNSVPALTALGNNLLRTGQMAAGRAALERAFAIDPFHLWDKNTLDLLDRAGRLPDRDDRPLHPGDGPGRLGAAHHHHAAAAGGGLRLAGEPLPVSSTHADPGRAVRSSRRFLGAHDRPHRTRRAGGVVRAGARARCTRRPSAGRVQSRLDRVA